ncbi:hypothetical protein LPUS_04534 [Lasallia pustulata]|uniref:Tf2-1-like SH3-like domain-containing protein n=1 Tax=Lasallia pustulata TaxID=136370 RepID=A0A1W5CXD6_9LECA|nr:hypothetical protein LPUS_04534 [Lasallia pustulata]
MHDIIGVLQENLTAAQARYEAQANRKRDAAPAYRVGDKVFFSMKNIATDRPSKKFDQQYLGEYTITKVVNSHAYQLDLPPEYKSLHDVFHPNLLLPCPTDPFPGQTNEKQRPIGIDIDGQKLWAVDAFLDTRRHNSHFRYQVLWRGNPQVGRLSAHNTNTNSLAFAATIVTATIAIVATIISTITIAAMSVFTAINVPRLSDLSSAAAAGNGGNLPPPNKPVGLRAQCDEEGTGSESTGEFVVVDTTARKKKGNRVGKQPVWRSKRARSPPLDDASDGDDSCPEWCRGDNNLPARMQQARRRGRAIWAQSNRTLSGGSRCGACVRAGADECFMAQTPVCAHCTSLRNPRRQCLAEPPASATPDSGSPGVVAAPAATYGGSGGMGTR